MEIPIKLLKIIRCENTIPVLSKKGFDQLKKSIEKWGIIEPLIINQHNIIICGKERYRAALLVGLENVPVVVRETSNQDVIQAISLEENLRRKHFILSQKEKGTEAFYQLDTLRKKRKNISRKRRANIEGNTTPQLTRSSPTSSRHSISGKLIPELSELLDQKKINQESASIYAGVSFENQKRIYTILTDDFSDTHPLKNKS